MDTSEQAIGIDSLGRRGGPRRRRSIAEKRQIVEETLRSGMSVAVIARRYEVNANSVFGWRRQYNQGLLGAPPASLENGLLPVQIQPAVTGPRSAALLQQDGVEIELKGIGTVRAHGSAAHGLVREIVDLLLRR